jgi:hypothetical protein
MGYRVPALPNDVVPVAAVLSKTTATLCQTSSPLLVPYSSVAVPAPPLPDFFAMIARLPFWQSSLLRHLDRIQNIDSLQTLLGSGETLQL